MIGIRHTVKGAKFYPETSGAQGEVYRKFNFTIRNIFSSAKKIKEIRVSNSITVKITLFVWKTDIQLSFIIAAENLHVLAQSQLS